jgi:hypothetical protein
VKAKARESWKLEHWASGLRWYWDWLELGEMITGIVVSSKPGNPVAAAVETMGARRGLAKRTRDAYSGWCRGFGDSCGSEAEAKDEGRARDWLTDLVENAGVSFATQKQALNALVFYFREVCGRRKWIWE